MPYDYDDDDYDYEDVVDETDMSYYEQDEPEYFDHYEEDGGFDEWPDFPDYDDDEDDYM